MSPITRRQLLLRTGLTGAAVVSSAGIGAVVAALADLPKRAADEPIPTPTTATSAPPAPPAELVAALARENALIAATEAAQAAPAVPAAAAGALRNIAADHRSHADALAALIGSAGGSPTAASSPPNPSSSAGGPGAVAALMAAERTAAQLGAADSVKLHGSPAVLLASIAACEAGHVELLT